MDPLTYTNKIEEANKFLDEDDPNSAADILQELMRTKIAEHGEMSFECADIYHLYGKALLECARNESKDLLFSMTESKDKPLAETVDTIRNTPVIPVTSEIKESQTETTIDEPKEEKKEEEEENAEKDGNDGEETKEEAEEGAPESEETAELAWQWLDLSRVLYEKEIEKATDETLKNKLRFLYAEVLSTVGQLCLEIENHETAVHDLALCLNIRSQLLPSTDRILAETHFFYGLAEQLANNFEVAVTHYEKAKSIIEQILADPNQPEAAKKRLQATYADLENKVVETRRLVVSGEDEDERKKATAVLKELHSTEPPVADPKAVIGDRVVHDLGVFGFTGKKRSKEDEDFEQPDAKKKNIENQEN